MPNFLSVSDVARRLGIAPKVISDAFYARRLDEARAPLVAGRRVIPEDYVDEVAEILRACGKLSAEASSC